MDLTILELNGNIGYLPKPIPDPRDQQIGDLLSRSLADGTIARMHRLIGKGHAQVLQAYAERMASAAVRTRSAESLRLGLVALLLTFIEQESRDSLTILPLFCDAIERLQLQPAEVGESLRLMIGDRLLRPFEEFLRRRDRSLQSMGYRVSADAGGFRYVRDW